MAQLFIQLGRRLIAPAHISYVSLEKDGSVYLSIIGEESIIFLGAQTDDAQAFREWALSALNTRVLLPLDHHNHTHEGVTPHAASTTTHL